MPAAYRACVFPTPCFLSPTCLSSQRGWPFCEFASKKTLELRHIVSGAFDPAVASSAPFRLLRPQYSLAIIATPL